MTRVKHAWWWLSTLVDRKPELVGLAIGLALSLLALALLLIGAINFGIVLSAASAAQEQP